MVALHHAIPAVAASGPAVMCTVNLPRCREYDILSTYLRHRFDCAAGTPGYGVSRRVLDRLGYATASIIALHHAKPAGIESRRSGVHVVNALRCRK